MQGPFELGWGDSRFGSVARSAGPDWIIYSDGISAGFWPADGDFDLHLMYPLYGGHYVGFDFHTPAQEIGRAFLAFAERHFPGFVLEALLRDL